MLAHVASAEGIAAVDTILNQGKDLVYDMMPYNLYGSIEIASIGLTEESALAKGFIVETGKFPFSANGKALIEDSAEGFVKIVYDKTYGEILGVHIYGENATDLISEAALAMRLESTIYDIAMVTHPHPTQSEVILESAFKGIGEPIHIL
jgi:dihydrolipoamide dehydrogenase